MVSAPRGEQVVDGRTARSLDFAQCDEQPAFGKRPLNTHFVDDKRGVAELSDRLADLSGIERTGAGGLQRRIAGTPAGAPLAVTQVDKKWCAQAAGDSELYRCTTCGAARIK